MTTEEKLKHFMDTSIENATVKSAKMLEDYEKGLNDIFEDHKANAIRKSDLHIKLGADSLQKENNKELSQEQIKIKKEVTKAQDGYKEELFTEVKNLLIPFMATNDYQELLIKQIKQAKEFAKEQHIIIYITPEDEKHQKSLEKATGCSITVNEDSFLGGTRAIIEEKNILIDNSFETLLKEEKDKFTFINK